MADRNLQALINEIDSLVPTDFSSFQSVEGLKTWATGEKRNLDGVECTKVFHDQNQVRFFCRVPPGIKMNPQWHDSVEVCHIIGGGMINHRNKKLYFPNQKVIFSKGEQHEPGNISETEFAYWLVDFIF